MNFADDLSAEQRQQYIRICEKYHLPTVTTFIRNISNEKLNLAHCGIGQRALRGIAYTLKQNIEIVDLDLSDNNLGRESAATMGEVLRTNYFLKSLNLSCNHIADEGVRILFSAIEEGDCLEILNLSDNGISKKSADPLRQVLSNATSLKELYLSKNNLTEAICRDIRNGLENNSNLEVLDLSWNKLRGDCCSHVAMGITNTSLKTLNLAWNGCGDEVAVALGTSLLTNTSLLELNLDHNNISSDGFKEIAEALRMNKSLCTLRIQNNITDGAGLQALLDACVENELSALTTIDFSRGWISEQNDFAIKKLISRNPSFSLLHEGQVRTIKRLDESAIRLELFTAMKHYILRNRLRSVDVFSKWDDNENSFISREEFIQSIHACMPVRLHRFKIDLLLSWLDKHNTGYINYREFLRIVRQY